MDVYWLEQSEADVRDDESWLSADEARQLAAMRVPKRRTDWRLGRWTAKRAVARFLGLPDEAAHLSKIEISAAESGAPQPFLEGDPAALSLSLSHCSGKAVCALAPAGALLGCDLESIEPRGNAFLSDYFTEVEQDLVAASPEPRRWLLLALLWSAKESALKALQCGLRRDTRSVQIIPIGKQEAPPLDWLPFKADCGEGRVFEGFWRRRHDLVNTLVAEPTPFLPIEVDLAPGPTYLRDRPD